MLYSIQKREDLENINNLVSLNNHVNDLRLQNKLGKQNFHENIKKLYQPLNDTNKNTSRDISKTITESSIQNNKALEKLNDKLLEIFNDTGKIARYFLSPLSKITNSENISHVKLIKDSNSNRVNGLWIHNTKPVTLFNNLITFRDTEKRV